MNSALIEWITASSLYYFGKITTLCTAAHTAMEVPVHSKGISYENESELDN